MRANQKVLLRRHQHALLEHQHTSRVGETFSSSLVKGLDRHPGKIKSTRGDQLSRFTRVSECMMNTAYVTAAVFDNLTDFHRTRVSRVARTRLKKGFVPAIV